MQIEISKIFIRFCMRSNNIHWFATAVQNWPGILVCARFFVSIMIVE